MFKVVYHYGVGTTLHEFSPLCTGTFCSMPDGSFTNDIVAHYDYSSGELGVYERVGNTYYPSTTTDVSDHDSIQKGYSFEDYDWDYLGVMGPWKPNTTYKAHMIVGHCKDECEYENEDGSEAVVDYAMYICTEAHTSSDKFEMKYWRAL